MLCEGCETDNRKQSSGEKLARDRFGSVRCGLLGWGANSDHVPSAWLGEFIVRDRRGLGAKDGVTGGMAEASKRIARRQRIHRAVRCGYSGGSRRAGEPARRRCGDGRLFLEHKQNWVGHLCLARRSKSVKAIARSGSCPDVYSACGVFGHGNGLAQFTAGKLRADGKGEFRENCFGDFHAS
jgi:hypothetical protein